MSSEMYLVGFSKELDFRPMEFVDLHSTRSCCLCNVVPRMTFLLGCSHAFCELCCQNLLTGDRRCPLDEVDFEEDDVSKLGFKPKHLERQNVRCFNSKNGCCVVGTVEEVRSHFFNECTYYAVTCKKCKSKVLRRDIVSHYGGSCHQESTSSSSSTAVQSGRSLDLVKRTSVSVENVECQLNSYADEIDSLKNMAIKNEQLLNRLLENQQCVAAAVGKEIKVMQHVHDQGQIKESLSRITKILSVTEIQPRNCPYGVGDGNVEQLGERERDLTGMLEKITATLNCVKGTEEKLNSLWYGFEETTKVLDGNAKSVEKIPLIKTLFDTSMKVCNFVDSLCSVMVPPKTEAAFYFRNVGELKREARNGLAFRSSDTIVLCRYSMKLGFLFSKRNRDEECSFLLYFMLCQSPTDSELEWPFKILCTFRLVHPYDSTKDIVYSIDPTCDLENHKRVYIKPDMEQGKQIFLREKVAYLHLLQNDFFYGDLLCLHIKLHPKVT